ncbi:MAG: hypothetical protein ABI868_20175 [Acidobacteriota bacterium]
MNVPDIERMARDVLMHEAPQWSIATVERSGDRWRLGLQESTGATLEMVLVGGSASAVREAFSNWVFEYLD